MLTPTYLSTHMPPKEEEKEEEALSHAERGPEVKLMLEIPSFCLSLSLLLTNK